MIKNFLLIISILFFISNECVLSQDTLWELRKNKEDIKVYTRKKKNLKIIEFKAVTVYDGSVSSLVSVIKDVESYHKWMTDLTIAKKLKTINENEWYTYYMADTPWPLNDRDIIYCVRLFKRKERTIISLESKPDFIPETKGYVRIKKAKGKWVFTPVRGNKIQILYQFFIDFEINIPSWMMNLFIVDGPYNTIKDLKLTAAKSEKKN